jgi:hypothetical protein
MITNLIAFDARLGAIQTNSMSTGEVKESPLAVVIENDRCQIGSGHFMPNGY